MGFYSEASNIYYYCWANFRNCLDNVLNLKVSFMYNIGSYLLLTFKIIQLNNLRCNCFKPQIENIPHSDIFKNNIITNIFCQP